ncbi:MAG: DNA-directed DNA polymerase II small subunit [Candidatus Thermoplasmatota archaeon]|nr:DNA-directed DNA polymerase II small subunit [Candidatus Thermoplasmatota archaeon]
MSSTLFDNREKIISFFQGKGILLDPKALELMIEKSMGSSIVSLYNQEISERGYIEVKDVLRLISKPQKREASLEEIDFSEIKANSSVDDFRRVFVSRYEKLKKIVVTSGKLREVSSISAVKRMPKGYVKIVGMISDITETKNGHKKFRIEDTEDFMDVIIMNKNSLSKELLLNDEVIGVIGSKPEASSDRGKSEPVIFANEIIRPDIPDRMIDYTGREPEYVGSISDIHAGSKTFLRDSYSRMIQWIKKSQDESANLKHLILSGDVIDGIGVYPGQENDLEIINPYEQYEYLAEFVNEIPEDIKVYIMPGNHDTVRLAEPQPAFNGKIRDMFSSNVRFLPNPYNLVLNKKNITVYHGMALNDLIELIPGGSMDSVGSAIELMLKRRYMGSSYGGRTPIVPSQVDYHVMEQVPDIFITGHIHGHYTGNYRGVRYVNSSTWQSQTEYQKMMNYSPEPSILTLFDLNSMSVIKKNFST